MSLNIGVFLGSRAGNDKKVNEQINIFANWIVKNNHTLVVNFKTKHKHYGNIILEATYKNMRNELHWSDGNVWRRIRLDPSIVLDYYEKH